MPQFPPAERLCVGEVTLAVHRAGPEIDRARAVVLLLHGWPELAYSWRYQIPALAAAGYHVVAPDLRGFGDSDKPLDKEAYRMSALVGDVTGLLDRLGVPRAVVVGHDWGAIITWALPFYAPERLQALAGLNVPFRPRGSVPILKAIEAVYGPQMYILRFQEEGPAEAILERDISRTMRFFYRRPRAGGKGGGGAFSTPDLDLLSWLEREEETWPGEPLLDEEDLAVYVEAYRRGGFRQTLHYYRNLHHNWEEMARYQPPIDRLRIGQPALMITAEHDGVLPPRLADGIEVFFDCYRRVDIAGAGHWVQQEKPEEVTAALLTWLEEDVGV
ncbi:MAG: alpha/beta hydrolase [Alphaproteobacteria bacterium]|nr:MAG: alpha/beta hydrolase [Alphaproteobacteria bacterium]